MDVAIENRVTSKLFIGCILTSEVKMHLNQSSEWKKAAIVKSPEELITVHYRDQEYIGLFLPTNKLTLHELKAFDKVVISKLQEYCPELNIKTQTSCIFPQLFIT